MPAGIDLEGLANHRGSAFGRRVNPQPAQINFENRLAIQLLRLPWQNFDRLVLEDEGHAIGSVSIPLALFRQMLQAPLAVIEKPLTDRVDTVLHAYVQMNYLDFAASNRSTAAIEFSDYLRTSLQRIQRRLGRDLFEEVNADLNEALHQQFDQQDNNAHRVWIEKLLRHYYDPMYEFQLEKKLHRIVFRGNGEEFLNWAGRLQFRRRRDEV